MHDEQYSVFRLLTRGNGGARAARHPSGSSQRRSNGSGYRRRLRPRSTIDLGLFGQLPLRSRSKEVRKFVPTYRNTELSPNREMPGLGSYEPNGASLAVSNRRLEQEWLLEHRKEYAGQWVALDGSALLSHGLNGLEVLNDAKAKGHFRPLLVRVQDGEDLPFGGW